ACAYQLVQNGAINQGAADRIQAGIQRTRQLDFMREVPLELETRDQAEQSMIEDIGRDYSDKQLRDEGRAGAMIGLYPEGIDLKAATLKLLKSQIAGFYDAHNKKMILVEGPIERGFWPGMTELLMRRDLMG